MSKPILRMHIASKATVADLEDWLGIGLSKPTHIGSVCLSVDLPPFADGGYYGYYDAYKEDWTMKLNLWRGAGWALLEHALVVELIFEFSSRFGGTYLVSGDFEPYLLWKNGNYVLTQGGVNKFKNLSFMPGIYALADLPEPGLLS